MSNIITVNGQQREEFSFITADGATVFITRPDGTKVQPQANFNQQITLDYIRQIHTKVEAAIGKSADRISLHHSIYSKTKDNELGDFAETCYLDKRYDYIAKTNSLIIWDAGVPVYANDDGVITSDRAALADTLL